MKPINFAIYAMTAVLASGQAFAHTGVRDQVDEGKASYNAFTITHGCAEIGEGGPTPTNANQLMQFPVLGQSAVFPIGNNVVWRRSDGTVLGEGADPAGILNPSTTGAAATLSLSLTGYNGFESPFDTSHEIVDRNGAVQGLLWKDGAMEPKMNALTPWKITAPVIKDNCVSQLRIRIGVINYCDFGKNASNDASGPYLQPLDAKGRPIPRLIFVNSDTSTTPPTFEVLPQRNVSAAVYNTMPGGNGDNNRADWWFTKPYPGTSRLYKDPDLLQPTYWTTLIVNNSAADVAQCKGTPNYVTVEPTAPAFDEILSGRNTMPFSLGNSNL